jgi:hypothetical protein
MARVMCEVCGVGNVAVGDILVWDNRAGTQTCVITNCSPPLELGQYTVFAGETATAYVVGPTGEYQYKCIRSKNWGPGDDPRLIVK